MFIGSITNIYNEIEILMSIFTDIFINVDNEYVDVENRLYYNYINSLSDIDFKQYSENIDYTTKKIDCKIVILDIFICEIEHLTYEFILNIDNKSKYDIIDDKLLSDINIFEQISDEFNKQIIINYNYNIKYEKYKQINKINLLDFEAKNSIYYWIDHIALINSRILDNKLHNK